MTTSGTGEARVRGLDRAHSSGCGRLSPPRAPRENVGKVLATTERRLRAVWARRGASRVAGYTRWLVWGCRRGCDCMAGVAHRDSLLENDADAAARGVYERLFGLVAEAIATETVKQGTQSVDQVRQRVRASVPRALTQKSEQTGAVSRGRLTQAIAASSFPLGPLQSRLLLWNRAGVVLETARVGLGGVDSEPCQRALT